MEPHRCDESMVFVILRTIVLASFVTTTASFAQASSALQQLDEDLVRIVAQLKPAVVTLETAKKSDPPLQGPPLPPPQDDAKDSHVREAFRLRYEAPPGALMTTIGSGMIVSADGNILTNAHVLDNADEIQVALDDKRSFKAQVVGTDRETDIAVLRIKAESLPTITKKS